MINDKKVQAVRQLWSAGLLAHITKDLSPGECRKLAREMFDSAATDDERGFEAHAKISEAYGEFLTAEADRKIEDEDAA